MFTVIWLVLHGLVWMLAALYLLMTVVTWIATLHTLGLSSIRSCPRIGRLSFRASPIRELVVVILLPLVVVPLLSARGIGGEYLGLVPLRAMLLIGLLCFTLFLMPPTTLVFSSSTDEQLRWALSLKRFAAGRRVISLLDTGYMRLKPGTGDLWSFMSRRSSSLTDVLRTSDTDNWQAGVRELIELSPIVIVDTRVCTRALLFEASTMLSGEYKYKAIFVSRDDGASPVLERLLDEGIVSPECLVCVLKEEEVGPLLQRLVSSRAALPKPGSFACPPSRIAERVRQDWQRQAASPAMTAQLQDSQPSVGSVPGEEGMLSTSLTPFWRLLAKWAILQSLLSAVCGLLLVWTTQLAFNGLAASVVWSLLVFNCVICTLYFYLARSLKKVRLRGDSLFVSDRAQEREVHISQISRVRGPDWTTLRRITIYLHRPSAFGEKIVFAGKLFRAGMIARDLQRRLYSYAETQGAAHSRK